MSRKYKFYNKDGVYFVSFDVVYWIDLFVRETYFSVFAETLNFYSKNRLELFAYCIMPSHVHLLFRDKESKPDALLGNIKRYASRQLQTTILENGQESRKEWMLWMMERAAEKESNVNKRQLWQHNNQPIELWSKHVVRQKLDYIHKNPVEAGFVTEPHFWKYSSAIDYAGGKSAVNVQLIV